MIVKALCGMVAMGGLLLVSGSDDLTGIKCVINGEKGASKEVAAKHLDGEVYCCCGGCKAKFEKAPEEYTTKANHQLVVSGQYVQKGCPMSGGAVTEGTTVEVGGAKVGFCCNGCKSKVENAEDLAAKAKLVFTADAFKKAFVKKDATDDDEEVDPLKDIKCMMMPKKAVNKDQAVEYMDAKVYFCCGGCAGKFKKDPAKFATQANHQLVATKQFEQTGCPFSGSPVDEEQMVKINGVKVGFCCENCKGKVDGAEDDAARVKMVFGEETFKKGFAAKKK